MLLPSSDGDGSLCPPQAVRLSASDRLTSAAKNGAESTVSFVCLLSGNTAQGRRRLLARVPSALPRFLCASSVRAAAVIYGNDAAWFRIFRCVRCHRRRCSCWYQSCCCHRFWKSCCEPRWCGYSGHTACSAASRPVQHTRLPRLSDVRFSCCAFKNRQIAPDKRQEATTAITISSAGLSRTGFPASARVKYSSQVLR